MELNQFILTLPSNSSSDLYKNTKSNFKTKLISTINMPENTVVGLKEIIFPLNNNQSDCLYHGTQSVPGPHGSRTREQRTEALLAASGRLIL